MAYLFRGQEIYAVNIHITSEISILHHFLGIGLGLEIVYKMAYLFRGVLVLIIRLCVPLGGLVHKLAAPPPVFLSLL